MCFFKRKKQVTIEINSKFNKGDYVNFRHRDELYFGWIWTIYYRYVEGVKEVTYDIQIAGQCPTIVRGVSESKVLGIKQN